MEGEYIIYLECKCKYQVLGLQKEDFPCSEAGLLLMGHSIMTLKSAVVQCSL